jgi:hypothetical protein
MLISVLNKKANNCTDESMNYFYQLTYTKFDQNNRFFDWYNDITGPKEIKESGSIGIKWNFIAQIWCQINSNLHLYV